MTASIPVDLAFHLTGTSIPADHGFALYGAISRLLPDVHESNCTAILPIRGRIVGDRIMQVTAASRLVIRTNCETIAILLTLAGKQLIVDGYPLRVGVPEIQALTPSDAVRSRLVVIKISRDTPTVPTADEFLAALRRKLSAFSVSAERPITIGKRRTLRLHQKEIVGYEVIVDNLTPAESLALQSNAPREPAQRFARNHMGCGVFIAWRKGGAR